MSFSILSLLTFYTFQFYRSFPGPPEVTEKEMHLLVTKYGDPDKAGLLNYLNLHHDITAIGQHVSRVDDVLIPTDTRVDFVPAIVSFFASSVFTIYTLLIF